MMKIALKTDGSGNVGAISTPTGSGSTFVLQDTPTLTTPNIGAANGTSLNLSGLTATRPVVTDGSKNLSSASITGTAGSAVVLQESPTLTTPNIGTATGTQLTMSDSVFSSTGLTRTSASNSTCVTNSTGATNFSFINMNTTAAGNFYLGKGNTGTPSGGSAVDGRGVLWLSGDFPMDFYTNNTARMTIKNDGYIRYHLAAYADKLIWHDANGVAQPISVGTSGQVLTSNGAGVAPSFQ